MIINLNNIEVKIDIIRMIFICYCTYFTFLRISNDKKYFNFNKIICYVILLILAILIIIIEYKTTFFISIICMIFVLSCVCYINTTNNLTYSIVTTIISLAFNYIILFISIVIVFFINRIKQIQNDIFNLLLIITIHIFILFNLLRIKKIKYGVSFLNNNMKNEYLDIIVLNMSIIILFSIIILVNFNIELANDIIPGIIVFAIIMFITIQKSLQLYYKQKLLIQDLNETKEELEKKNQEIEQLEKENLEFSKKSHSLAHKQRALEYQINQILLKSADSQKTDSNNKTENKQAKLEKITKVKNEINKLSKEMYSKTATVELTKTGIYEIDNILEYMQSECNKNNIDFHLQIIGNIYHMTNKIIEKEDLQILLADHIKNAIIAIKHSDNINKSILVKLGKINGIYSLYIYDSGIEFKKETLLNLGKKPSTTHAEEGGTGMGFMNTFDTLKKYNASLVINEIGKPNKDNYTKILIIKFDNKCEFKLISYRQEEIGEILEKLVDKSTTSDIIVENKS